MMAVPGDAVSLEPGPHPLLGTWEGTVHIPDGDHQARFSFSRNGGFCLVAGGTGSGRWWRTGENRFSFKALEKFHNEDGTFLGAVAVNQAGVHRRGTFRSSGLSYYYDADGNLEGSGVATITATRVRRDALHCR